MQCEKYHQCLASGLSPEFGIFADGDAQLGSLGPEWLPNKNQRARLIMQIHIHTNSLYTNRSVPQTSKKRVQKIGHSCTIDCLTNKDLDAVLFLQGYFSKKNLSGARSALKSRWT